MKLYTSIDYLPTYNYFKILEGDLRFLSYDIEKVEFNDELLKHYD